MENIFKHEEIKILKELAIDSIGVISEKIKEQAENLIDQKDEAKYYKHTTEDLLTYLMQMEICCKLLLQE
jgi:spermidine/putrescine-binding protein